MIIANPIYDVVFKRLMENEKVAKFFIGTFLEQDVELLDLQPQEYTYEGLLETKDASLLESLKLKIEERLAIRIFRMDFVALVRTKEGENKKILIEVQKAQDIEDVLRFRRYLAEHYKREDKVGENGEKEVLPITTIYILGFVLPDIPTPCIKVERQYKDLINSTILDAKSDFVEKLTHDSFVVQVNRIGERYQTRLDKLLSVFEQRYFVEDGTIVKEYKHEAEIEELKLITNILHYVGTDPKERKKIADEEEAWRTIAAYMQDLKRKAARLEKELEKNAKALQATQKVLEEKDRVLVEKDRVLEEKDRVLREIEEQNAMLLKQLEELQKGIKK